ncbi:hypothetical protein ACFSL6_17605 [Paenibacillus thailandensis]|uniref:Uncharacterized protein n=1 Tax=Paenibacillus thailandensis TaxID=393250 RepID=A0ABW5R2I2_9BACL
MEMGVLAPAFKVAGIAIGSEFVAMLMEENGHGNKVMFVKIASWVSCAYVALDFWWEGLRHAAAFFGVYI